MVELLEKGLSAIQAVYVAIGIGGITALISVGVALVKGNKKYGIDIQSAIDQATKAYEKKQSNRDVDLLKIIDNLKEDNGKLSKMFALVAAKIGVSAEDLSVILNNYVELSTLKEEDKELATTLVKDAKNSEEKALEAKASIDEQISEINDLLG